MRLCCLAAVAMLACACGDDDGAGWNVSDPGGGVANSAPLWSTSVGTRYAFDYVSPTTVLGPTERWGKDVLRVVVGDDVQFVRAIDDGVLLDGTARLGQSMPSTLLVPSTVRDGMKWENLDASGNAVAHFVVAAQGKRATLFGTLPVWRVSQTDPGFTDNFTEYAEGRGVVGGLGYQTISAVVPLEPRTTPKTRERLPLVAAGDGAPLSSDIVPVTAGLIRPPSGPATLRVNGGAVSFILSSTHRSPAVLCAQVSGGVVGAVDLQNFPDGSGSAATCADGAEAALQDGQVVGLPVDSYGAPELPIGGPFVDADGLVRAIGPLGDHGDGKFWVRDEPGTNTFGDLVPGHAGYLDLPWRQEGNVSRVMVGAVHADDAVGFVARLGDRLFHGVSDHSGFSTLRLVGTTPGTVLSATVDGDARRLLLVSADGTVDELTISTEGTSLTRLAELALPKEHELIAAFPGAANAPSDLFVLTIETRLNWTTATDAGVPKPGNLFAWHVTLPAATDPAQREAPSAAALSIVAVPSGPDVQVCWPQVTKGKADTIGWTLGGHPAKVISSRADDSCVVVLRDLSLPFDPTAVDAWLVEGPVPGVGRVAIAQAPSFAEKTIATPELQLVLGALAGGGFVSNALTYTSALTIVGAPADPVPTLGSAIQPGFADTSGLGVYGGAGVIIEAGAACGLSPSPCLGITRWGAETVHLHAPSGFNAGPRGPLGGGGLLWKANSDDFLLKPDGAVVALPPANTNYVNRYFGGRSDGLACGSGSRMVSPNMSSGTSSVATRTAPCASRPSRARRRSTPS